MPHNTIPDNTTRDNAIPVITIDGPSGSGKGTIGLKLAKEFNWHFLDSGAVYRALALASLMEKVDLANEKALESLAQKLDLKFDGEIWLSGKKITEDIRSEACSQTASKIAIFPKVRAALLDLQRAFRKSPGLIADGRDMGTVVFPQAILKIFLEASPEDRAKRRYLQLKDTAHSVTLERLLTEIKERDQRDQQRAVAPLKPAKDAVVIDTTGIGVETVFEQVMKLVRKSLYINV